MAEKLSIVIEASDNGSLQIFDTAGNNLRDLAAAAGEANAAVGESFSAFERAARAAEKQANTVEGSVALLGKEIDLQKQVNAGQISLADKAESLARARAGGNKELGDLLAQEAKLKVELDGVRKATEAVGNETDEAASSTSRFSSIIAEHGGKVATAVTAAAALGIAYNGISFAVSGVNAAIGRGAEIDAMSKSIGVAAEEVSAFGLIADATGTSIEVLARANRNLARNVDQALQGTGEATRGFNQLGIEVERFRGLSASDLMGELADVFQELGPSMSTTRLAMLTIGEEAGPAMLSAMLGGREEFERFQNISRDLGLTLSGETAEALAKVSSSFTILGSTQEAVFTQITAGLAPGLGGLTDSLVDLVAGVGIADGGLKKFGQTLGEILADAADEIDDLRKATENMDLDQALGVVLSELNGIVARQGLRLGGVFVENLARGIFITEFGRNLSNNQLENEARAMMVRVGEQAGAEFRKRFGEEGIARLPEELQEKFKTLAGTVNQSLSELRTSASDAIGARSQGDLEVVRARLTEMFTTVSQLSGVYGVLGVDTDRVLSRLAALLQSTGSELSSLLGLTGSAGDGFEGFGGEVDEVTKALQGQRDSLLDQVAAAEEYNRAFDEAIGSGASFAEATESADAASARFTVQLAAEEKGATALSASILSAFDRLRELNEEKLRAGTVATFDEEIAALQRQSLLYDGVIEGTRTREEAERAIAIHLEEQALRQGNVTDGVEEMAARIVDAREETDRLREAADKVGESFLDVGGAITDSLRQVTDALISGTLDFENIGQSLGIALGERFFDAIIEEKELGFDVPFKLNVKSLISDLGGSVKGLFDGIFSGDVSGLGNLFTSDGSSSNGVSLGGLGGNSPTSRTSFGLPPGISADQVLGQNTDGSFLVQVGQNEDGSPITETIDGIEQKNFGFGDRAGGALVGAGGGFTGAQIGNDLFIRDSKTKLPSFLGSLEDDIIARSELINSIFSTVIGGVLGAGVGGAGGGLGGGVIGLISGLFGSELIKSIDLESFEKGRFTGSGHQLITGGGVVDFIPGMGDFVSEQAFNLLGLPRTRGGAIRSGLEPFLNESDALNRFLPQRNFNAFSGEQVGQAISPGGDGSVRRFFEDRGISEEGFTQIRGMGEALFGDIARELEGEQLGDTAFNAGLIIAETFTQGVESGLSEQEILESSKAALNAFAHEQGLTLRSVLSRASEVQEGFRQLGQGDGTKLNADQEGFDAFGRTVAGAIEVFETDFPAGTQAGLVALQSMTRDGALAFENLTQAEKEALLSLMNDFESTSDLFEHLASQGFEIDISEFDDQIQSAAESAAFIGENMLGSISAASGDAEGVVQDMMTKIGALMSDTFFTGALSQLFDSTAIGQAFQPVFAVLDRMDTVNLMDAGERGFFTSDLVAALAEGRGNLEQYIPIIREIVEAGKEFDAVIEEALKPDPMVAFFDEMEARTQAIGSEILGVVQNAARAGIEAGDAILADGGSFLEAAAAGIEAFTTTFEESITNAVATAIITGITQAAVIEGTLAPLLTQLEVETAAAMADGVIDSTERANLAALGEKIIIEGERAGAMLAPIFGEIFTLKTDATVLTEAERQIQALAEEHGLLPADVEAFLLASEGVDPDALKEYFRLIEENNEPLRASARAFREIDDSVSENNLIAFFKASEGVDPELLTDYFATLAEHNRQLNAKTDFILAFDERVAGLDRDTLFEFLKSVEGVDPQALEDYFNAIIFAKALEEREAKRLAEERATATTRLADTTLEAADHLQAAGDAAVALAFAGQVAADQLERIGGVSFPGLATGGSIGAGGAAVVGEAGRPELVISNGAGGFDVIPLDHESAAALMGGGVPGFADGTLGAGVAITPGGGGVFVDTDENKLRRELAELRRENARLTKGGSGGGGPAEPDRLGSFSVSDILSGFATDEIRFVGDAVEQTVGGGVLSGLTQGFQEGAVIQGIVRPLEEEMAKAMEDGVLSLEEAEGLRTLAGTTSQKLKDAIKAAGPAFDIIAEEFGLKLEEEVVEKFDPIGEAFEELMAGLAPGIESGISSSISSGLIDGTLTAMDGTMTDILRQSVGKSVLGGVVEAFVVGGVLGAEISRFAFIVGEEINLLMTGVITQEHFNLIMTNLTNGFIGTIEPIIDVLGQGLEPLRDLFNLDDIVAGVQPVVDSARDVVDVSRDICTAKCDLVRDTAELGEIGLNLAGGRGSLSIDRFVPKTLIAEAVPESDDSRRTRADLVRERSEILALKEEAAKTNRELGEMKVMLGQVVAAAANGVALDLNDRAAGKLAARGGSMNARARR